MNLKLKIRELTQKLLGVEELNEFIEKNERRMCDLEFSCDKLDENLYDLEDRIDCIERKEILDYDSDDFISSQDNDLTSIKDFEELELLVNRLAKAVKVLASKTDMEFKIDSILEGAEDD